MAASTRMGATPLSAPDAGAAPPVLVKLPGERRSLSRSATRALDVLELFGQVRRPMRAVEIAHALELHASTTDQLLKTMLGSAHLTFDAAAKTYLPSPRLAAFGAWMVESYGADERLRSLVRDVHAQTGEVATLTTANDLFMQIVDLAGAPAVQDDGPAERGLRVSIFGSASGAAYLSLLSDAEVARLADRARLKPDALAALKPRIAQVRRDGVADGPSLEGRLWSVAAPLPPRAAPARLVLGMAGPAERVRPRLDALRTLMIAYASG